MSEVFGPSTEVEVEGFLRTRREELESSEILLMLRDMRRTHLLNVLLAMIGSLAASIWCEPVWSCPLADAHAKELNQELLETCGTSAPKWDLSEYVPDDELCSGRQAALSLVQRQILELCKTQPAASRPQAFRQIQTLHARARLVSEFEFQKVGRSLAMVVPIKESPVLSNWNEHVALLNRQLGFGEPSTKQGSASAAGGASSSTRDVARSSEQAADEAREKEREQTREKKRNALQTQLEASAKRFQLKIQAVWASPSTDANEIARRQQEVVQLTTDFESEQKRLIEQIESTK